AVRLLERVGELRADIVEAGERRPGSGREKADSVGPVGYVVVVDLDLVLAPDPDEEGEGGDGGGPAGTEGDEPIHDDLQGQWVVGMMARAAARPEASGTRTT